MLEMMSENLQLRYVRAKSSDRPSNLTAIENESKERWKHLIYYLLNIEGYND